MTAVANRIAPLYKGGFYKIRHMKIFVKKNIITVQEFYQITGITYSED